LPVYAAIYGILRHRPPAFHLFGNVFAREHGGMFTFKEVKIILMSNNTKLLLGFIVGAAAGAAIGVLLTSDKGKEILERLKETASELGDEFKDVIDKGKKMAEDMEEKVREYIKPV
jgi:hypothetical protein